MNMRDFATAEERRKALEEKLGMKLEAIAQHVLDEAHVSSHNCENLIGAVQVPLGVAGPLVFADTKEEVYVPLATTEGALVASIQRGMKAISQSGGAQTHTQYVGITRAPAFATKGIQQGHNVAAWIAKHFQELQQITATTSSHITLLSAEATVVGTSLFVRFAFDTQDAMGMNMATIASEKLCNFIEQQCGIHCVALSGNMCVDKKPNALNFIKGRGCSTWAEVEIPEQVVRDVLKTTPENMVAVGQKKLYLGSIMSGTLGANAHIANALAAIFLATGQDIAHISECSMGVTTVEQRGSALYISVYLPDLVIGTVGGGTVLTTQQEALGLMGIQGSTQGEHAKRLAEIIGATVLASEISLIASLAEGSLVKAHETLGRGKK